MLTRLARRLFAVDVLTVLFSAAVAALSFLSRARMPDWPIVFGVSLAIVMGLPALAVVRARLRWRLLDFLHDWAFAPLAYVIYLQMHALVVPLRGAWLADPTLIAIDRWLFGIDPSLVLARASSPWLTELLQLAYTSFYALMVTVGAELYLKRDVPRFHFYAFSCALGFFISFLGYVAVPAVGPRFTLFDVATVERQLPGLFLTPGLRAFVDGGGLVPPGLSKAAAMALAPRDVFPSGHTMMTLVAIYWSWRFGLRVRWVVGVVGALLVFATVYLRYHYVIDVLGGGALAVACVAMTPAVHGWIARISGEREASLEVKLRSEK